MATEEVKATVEETVETATVNNTENTEETPGKMKMYAQAACEFGKGIFTEKVEAYKKDPVKEGTKDLVTGLVIYGGYKIVKATGKAIIKLFTKKKED